MVLICEVADSAESLSNLNISAIEDLNKLKEASDIILQFPTVLAPNLSPISDDLQNFGISLSLARLEVGSPLREIGVLSLDR